MKIEFKITSDNSPTLFLPEMNETYHSIHGARQESEHVYIKSGLQEFIDKKEINVFEMGFGTGLNVLLTQNFARENQISISVTTIEKYPLNESIWKKLNYPKTDIEQYVFDRIHQSEWGKKEVINEFLNLTKLETSLLDYKEENAFDLIYFDAFAPDKQPELWTVAIFEKLFTMLVKGGALVTYSAKGQVRRDMQEAGLTVERIPGPPGKREMLRAWK